MAPDPVLSTKDGSFVARPKGSSVMNDAFPLNRPLWQLVAERKNGFSNPFLLTALQINGRVVLLQEFGGAHEGSWDVFVPATDSGKITDTVAAVEAAVKLTPHAGALAGPSVPGLADEPALSAWLRSQMRQLAHALENASYGPPMVISEAKPVGQGLAGPESAAEHVRNALQLLDNDWLLPSSWKPGDHVPELKELPEMAEVAYRVLSLAAARARLVAWECDARGADLRTAGASKLAHAVVYPDAEN